MTSIFGQPGCQVENKIYFDFITINYELSATVCFFAIHGSKIELLAPQRTTLSLKFNLRVMDVLRMFQQHSYILKIQSIIYCKEKKKNQRKILLLYLLVSIDLVYTGLCELVPE